MKNIKNSKVPSKGLSGKDARSIFNEKGVSAHQKFSDFSKKMVIKKQSFQLQKHEKYLKSKNGVKKPLGAFNEELWPDLKFHKEMVQKNQYTYNVPSGSSAQHLHNEAEGRVFRFLKFEICS